MTHDHARCGCPVATITINPDDTYVQPVHVHNTAGRRKDVLLTTTLTGVLPTPLTAGTPAFVYTGGVKTIGVGLFSSDTKTWDTTGKVTPGTYGWLRAGGTSQSTGITQDSHGFGPNPYSTPVTAGFSPTQAHTAELLARRRAL